MTLSAAEKQSRKEYVLELRQRGCRNQEIAGKLGLSISTVAATTTELIRDGKIESIRGNEHLATWKKLTSERVQTIITLRRQRATNEEIGSVLGITRERARQLIKKITETHGEQILEPQERLWTTTEAAELMGMRLRRVSLLCRKGEVPYRLRVGEKQTYLLDKEGIEALRHYPQLGRERVCIICEQPFTPKHSQQKTCSPKCRVSQRARRCQSYYRQVSQKEPTSDNLRGWVKKVWERLHLRKQHENEAWLTFSQALQRAEVKKIQLSWLRRRKIVSTQPGPINNFGRATFHYAASEMDIVRQVYQKWLKKQQKTKQ